MGFILACQSISKIINLFWNKFYNIRNQCDYLTFLVVIFLLSNVVFSLKI